MANSYFDSFGEEYVASMNNSIRDAEVKATNGYVMPPDGKYQMRIQSIQVKESNSEAGYPNFIVQLVVLDGDHRGKSVYKRYSLEPNPMRLEMLKSDLFLLGVDLRSIYDLENEELMSGILDMGVDVVMKTNVSKTNGKSYTNIYFNRCFGKVTASDQNSDFNPFSGNTPWGE